MAYEYKGRLKTSRSDLKRICERIFATANKLAEGDPEHDLLERALTYTRNNQDLPLELWGELQRLHGKLFRKRIRLSADRYVLMGGQSVTLEWVADRILAQQQVEQARRAA